MDFNMERKCKITKLKINVKYESCQTTWNTVVPYWCVSEVLAGNNANIY